MVVDKPWAAVATALVGGQKGRKVPSGNSWPVAIENGMKMAIEIVNLPIENGDFPYIVMYVSLPEGMSWCLGVSIFSNPSILFTWNLKLCFSSAICSFIDFLNHW